MKGLGKTEETMERQESGRKGIKKLRKEKLAPSSIDLRKVDIG